MKVFAARALIAALVGGMLAGCTDADFRRTFMGRWGPNPALSPTETDTVIRDQTQLLRYIELEAGLIKLDGAGGYVLAGTQTEAQLWYSVAQWGFNVGR